MRKRQLTLLGSLLCVLTLTACNVEVNIDGDINANIDTSIDLGDTDGDTGGDTGGSTGGDSDTKENVPTEITLSLTASAEEVTVGDSVDISFSTSPAGVSVSFSSSDTSLATVTNNGHVTTLAPGTVTITAVASLEGYNDVSDSIVITINPVIDEGGDEGSGGGSDTGGDDEGTGGGSGSGGEPGDEPGSTDVTTYGVEITNGESLTPLEIGETVAVSVSLLTITNDEETGRDIATADDVKLSSSETGVLSINDLEITALSAGETILTATWTDKGVQSSGVSITVNAASSEEPGETPKAIQISFKQDVYSVEVEDTVTVDVDVIPENATVVYSSDNTSVAKVNEYGVVTGVSAGSATLTATATLEGYETGVATCAINVTAKSEEEVIGAYAIYGDLLNSHWNAYPETDSEYYLPYTANSNSRVWTRTITIADEDIEADGWDEYYGLGWSASFCIVEYGDEDETVIAGYSAVDTANSTGVVGGSEEDHIEVYWRNEYTLTIDLSDLSNPSITITCLSEYDSAYALYGDFTEASWQYTPLLTSDFALRYNSKDSSTMSWSATVTTEDTPDFGVWDPWLAGFRIVKYGDYETSVATYSNVASDSPIKLGEGDDGNIKLNWNTTYVITIDGTSGTLSISISEYSEGGDSGDAGGDSGTDEPVTAEYALVGDFNDSSWNEYPSKTSDYYHYYSSAEESTYTWELTVTMAAGTDKDYDPSFYVTPYGEWNAVIGFSELDSNSTGVKSTQSKDGGVCVDWGCTYDIYIDLSDSSNFSILVTLVEDEEEEDETYNIDGYYVLSGNLSEGTWIIEPGYDSDYALPYDSSKSNSKYWTRTITTGSNPNDGTSAPSFRVLEYNTWTTVANFNNVTIDSASTGVLSSYVGSDYNIGLDAWDTAYDLTIDLRGSAFTILINYHDDNFEAGINGKTGGSSSGGSSSVGDPLNIDDTYIMGVDISSIKEVIDNGGKFYDYDGTAIDSGLDGFMTYLASQGVNYVRIRLWNSPYVTAGNSSSGSFGGGGNDITTDLAIAKAAADAGLKICLDFHYSDFWVHPGQQVRPREWANLSGSDLTSTAATWTTDVLTQFKEADCEPSMVQIGNEINGASIAGLGTSTSPTSYEFVAACCNAVRSYNSGIKIALHLSTASYTGSQLASYFNAFASTASYDIVGISFYTYWHGSVSDLKSILNTLKSSCSGKEVCVMEYSYGWTTEWEEGHGNMNNDFWTEEEEAGGYAASVEGQTQCIYDTNKAVADVGGIGAFYWEPAWLSVSGSTWASTNALNYYQTYIDDTAEESWFGFCNWANQALFNYSGRALNSLKIFSQMRG